MLIKRNRFPVKEIILYGILPSFLKLFIYKLKGYRIGKGVSIGFGSIILGKDVMIGDYSKIGFITIIRSETIKIGRYVRIGSFTLIDTEKIEIDDDARINEQVIIGGLRDHDSYIKIGKRTIIMEYSFINPTKPVVIGDDSGIGGHCLLFTHGSWLSQLDGFPVSFAPITLGRNVWLPWRVFILPGVSIGDNVVVGANSLITKSFPSNSLIAGSPAKIIRENYPPHLSEEGRATVLEGIFESFIKYIEYNKFIVVKKEFSEGFQLLIKRKNKEHHLVYFHSSFSKEIYFSKDNLLIIDYLGDEQKANEKIKCDMTINLRRKSRVGTSLIGEEFISFISRYGIRFNRID